MNRADDDTPHQYAGAGADISQTHVNIDGAILTGEQVSAQAVIGNAGAQQKPGDETYLDMGEEVAIKQEPKERVQQGENCESTATDLPLNLQLASNAHWEQRGLLDWDSQSGNLQHNVPRQKSTVTSTNSHTDCDFSPQVGKQAQQHARGTSSSPTEQQQEPTQIASDRLRPSFGRPNMSLQTLSTPRYQPYTSPHGYADSLPSVNMLRFNAAFGQRVSMPSAFMPPAFVPPGLLAHSSMPNWAQQSTLPLQLEPFSWSDPLSANHHASDVRDIYDQPGVIEEEEEEEKEEGEEVSDDDEPLVTCVQRHRSLTLSASDRLPYPQTPSVEIESPTAGFQHGYEYRHGEASNIYEAAPNPNQNSPRIDQPASPISSEPKEISWRLPPYEAVYVPPATKDDLPLAKLSIPGLVREELLLSPDHTTQEFILFQQVFLPAQQALATPDPEPAHAVLNFHTIAVLVVEAFTQYEIGDEVSNGPSPRAPTAPDTPFSRQHSAKDADIDAIFFAVIDRWRAGLESSKQSLRLIRGAQEFCDIALDVIHYIKEYGLEEPEKPARKQREDKGVPRGPRNKDAQTGAEPSGPGGVKGKRKSEVEGQGHQNANTLPARKKAKAEKDKGKAKSCAKPGPKPGAKARSAPATKAGSKGTKAKSGGLTVIPWKK